MIFKQLTKFKQITKLFSLTAALALTSTSFMPYAAADVLKGGVLQEDQYKNSTPGLNRNDIQGDPFREGASSNNGPVDQMLELPPGGMDIGGLRAPAPQKKPMSGNAQDSGGDFNGQKMMPVQEDPPYTPPPQQRPPNLQGGAQGGRSNDPDGGSAEMQLLWDAWHKRVAESIFTRFNSLAQMAFKHSPPLACQVSYMVARDGRVGNVQVLQKSSNPIFNTMLLGVINSMNGNPVLEYPPNSRRQFVEKTGTFTWNYGQQGFKYTTGDQERIQQQRNQPGNNMQNNNMQQMQNNSMQQMRQPNQMMQNNNMQQMQNNNMQQMRQPNQMQQPMQMMQQMQQMFR
ncbi:MAG: hypothetical protein QG574_5621 [Cyanobacteriota bacterium erpe_2018_sw_21hr_WHONDRS-SW48-000092_B_bin.40]|nr:hypothetical protein [Cyanobacteriota bacterium erpe_2018_sw_21hr_WHONDRS-SW48-000092_B_bin.40]